MVLVLEQLKSSTLLTRFLIFLVSIRPFFMFHGFFISYLPQALFPVPHPGAHPRLHLTSHCKPSLHLLTCHPLTPSPHPLSCHPLTPSPCCTAFTSWTTTCLPPPTRVSGHSLRGRSDDQLLDIVHRHLGHHCDLPRTSLVFLPFSILATLSVR